MALGTNHITTTTSAVMIPEIWSEEVLKATRSNLVLADMVKRYDSMVKGKGDVLHIPQLSNLSANTKSASTQVTLQSPTETSIDLTIDQHKEASFLVEDIAEVQSNVDLMSAYTGQAGFAIAKAIDTSIAGLYSGLSQTVGDGNTNITDANVITAIKYLDNADAPGKDRFFVIRPAGKADLMAIDKFVLRTGPGWSPEGSPILKGPENADSGYWGNLYGVKVYYTTNIAQVAGTPSVDHALLFQREAFALALQQSPRTQSQYKQEYLADLVTVDVIYGVKELRDTFAVDFKVSTT